MITGIEQIHINIIDIERAIDFYQNDLGLPLIMMIPEQKMAFFSCGSSRLYLSSNPEYSSNPFIYYHSDQLFKDFARLKDRGAQIIKEPMIIHKTDQHESWLCAFKDSEGNTLHLMQDRALES